MSDYKPAVGDRVRAVVEGEVQNVDAYGCVWIGEASNAADQSAIEPAHTISIEKVTPPLPTTPGSVIQGQGSRVFWLLRVDGLWTSHNGGTTDVPPNPRCYDVIFDAGAKR